MDRDEIFGRGIDRGSTDPRSLSKCRSCRAGSRDNAAEGVRQKFARKKMHRARSEIASVKCFFRVERDFAQMPWKRSIAPQKTDCSVRGNAVFSADRASSRSRVDNKSDQREHGEDEQHSINAIRKTNEKHIWGSEWFEHGRCGDTQEGAVFDFHLGFRNLRALEMRIFWVETTTNHACIVSAYTIPLRSSILPMASVE